MIIVDTSVWVDHLRSGVPELAALLEDGTVLMHPFIIGKIACGNLSNRREVLGALAELPAAPVASDSETLAFIEARGIAGTGIGYIDAALLASAALGADARLWSLDRRLRDVARRVGLDAGL